MRNYYFPLYSALKSPQSEKTGFVKYREGESQLPFFLSYPVGTGKCRAKLFFVVHSAKDKRQVLEVAGKEVQIG